MKKIISILLTITLVFSCTCVFAGAVPLNSGKKALKEQFAYGQGPNVNGYSIDYRYFSPATEEGATKYPLVVWVHGHSHGQYEGYQIESNSISNWASDEYQARFGETGGAYILAVRAPEEDGISWSDNLMKPLKYAIDDFILKNKDTVDTTRIYIGGFSLGGMTTFKMATLYPEMFAAIFPICPYITISNSDASNFADTPVWLVSGKLDPLVSYSRTQKNWNAVINTTNIAEHCRFSTLSTVCYPDGTLAPSAHYSWEAVTSDMFSSNNGDYPHMSTVTGTGEDVSLTYPNGMISWLTQFTSNYSIDDIDISDTGKNSKNLNVLEVIKFAFLRVYIVLRNLFRPIAG